MTPNKVPDERPRTAPSGPARQGSSRATAGRLFVLWMARLSCLILAIGVAAGCSRAKNPSRTITYEWPSPLPDSKLLLGPGDAIEVKFRFNPELNEAQTIRPDGRISMQLIDEVDAAGLTPQELDQKLTKLYEASLVKPELTVFVRTMNGQRVWVGGEVKKPGVVLMPGKMTALEAIMEAGGFDLTSAKPSSVVVVRHVDGKRYARLVDLGSPLRKSASDAFNLAPGDIVFVPRTKITRVDQWVDQYLNRILPNMMRDFMMIYAIQTITAQNKSGSSSAKK